MSGYNNQSDPYDEFEGGSGGGLRKQLEEALSELRELKAERRTNTVTDLLKDKGIDPAVAAIIPKDADAKEWVEKHKHLLATRPETQLLENEKAGTEPAVTQVDNSDPALDAAHAAEQKALADIQQVAESGDSAIVTTDVLEQMKKVDSEEEFMTFLKSHGGLAD